MWAALRDPVGGVFILEPVFLMFLVAWLLARFRRKPGALLFIILSLVGSLAFSMPWVLRTLDRTSED